MLDSKETGWFTVCKRRRGDPDESIHRDSLDLEDRKYIFVWGGNNFIACSKHNLLLHSDNVTGSHFLPRFVLRGPAYMHEAEGPWGPSLALPLCLYRFLGLEVEKSSWFPSLINIEMHFSDRTCETLSRWPFQWGCACPCYGCSSSYWRGVQNGAKKKKKKRTGF